MTPDLHPDLHPLAALLGTWHGRGRGEYPTIESFEYDETVTFSHVGKPFLAYTQRTRAADDGRPLHAETGYLRPAGPGRAELMVAHPTGVVELDEGEVEVQAGDGAHDLVIHLRSTTVATSGTAKDVTAVERVITLAGDRLHYRLGMAAVGLDLTHHLEATLLRRPTT